MHLLRLTVLNPAGALEGQMNKFPLLPIQEFQN